MKVNGVIVVKIAAVMKPPSPQVLFFFGKLVGGGGFKEYYIIPAMVKMTQLYSTNAETHLDRECIPEGGSGEWGCC